MKILNKKDIFKFLKLHKIKKNDLVLIHGNALIFTQVIGNSKNEKISNFWIFIKEYFNKKGTVIVPSFTYCLTNNKVYNSTKTPGKLGLFSESFRKLKFTKRTNHPIFSMSFFGSQSKDIMKTSNNTCFGKNSLFEYLHKRNAKLLCLGCSYNESTYTHYIEEKLGIKYRYLKKFKGFHFINGKKKKIETNYFVRNLNYFISTKVNLKKLIDTLKKKSSYIYKNFGKLSSHSTRAKIFCLEAKKKLEKNKHYLIG